RLPQVPRPIERGNGAGDKTFLSQTSQIVGMLAPDLCAATTRKVAHKYLCAGILAHNYVLENVQAARAAGTGPPGTSLLFLGSTLKLRPSRALAPSSCISPGWANTTSSMVNVLST